MADPFGKIDVREIEMAKMLADILDQGPECRELFLDEQDFRCDTEGKVGLLIDVVYVGGKVTQRRRCLFYSDASLFVLEQGEPKVCELYSGRERWLQEVLDSEWYQQAYAELMLQNVPQ